MKLLNFTFKKTRRFGDLIQDYISLFKIIFKHLNAKIISIALPVVAVFILLIYYLATFVTGMINSLEPFNSISMSFIPMILILLVFLFFILITTFGIEYMFLLEERQDFSFTSKDIYMRIRQHLGKYIRFFLSSILVGLLIMIPFVIIAFVLNFIPIVGQLVLGIMSACLLLFFNCALFLYLQDREGIWDSYRASFRLIGAKVFEYGAASYVLQLMAQIILGFIALIPIAIIGIIAFSTIGFSIQFFDGFAGKFLVSIGGSILMLFLIFFSIYMVTFYVLQYFSLLESTYKEDTLEQINQIGGTIDEF